MLKNKRGQLDFAILTFIAVIIGILILAPVLLSIVVEIVGEVGTQINNTDATAGAAVFKVENTFTSLWDTVIILLFTLNMILLIVTSFFIDTHPAFLIVYILFAFFTVLFAPNMIDAVDKIYLHYSVEVGAYLPLTEFLVNNFEMIIFAVLILSGIIIYAKIKYFTNYR